VSAKGKARSLTLWANWVVFWVAFAAEVLPVFGEIFPEHAMRIAWAVSVANIILRHRTRLPVEPIVPRRRGPPPPGERTPPPPYT